MEYLLSSQTYTLFSLSQHLPKWQNYWAFGDKVGLNYSNTNLNVYNSHLYEKQFSFKWFLICPFFLLFLPLPTIVYYLLFHCCSSLSGARTHISFIFLSNTTNLWSIELQIITLSLTLRVESHIFIYSRVKTHFFWSLHLAFSNLITAFYLGTKEGITQTWLLEETKSISKKGLAKKLIEGRVRFDYSLWKIV